MPLIPVGTEAVIEGYNQFITRTAKMAEGVIGLQAANAKLAKQPVTLGEVKLPEIERLASMSAELAGMQVEAHKLAAPLEETAPAAEKAAGGLERLRGAASKLATGFVMGIGGAVGFKVLNFLDNLRYSAIGAATGAIQTAGRVQEMATTTRLLGQQAGYTASQTDALVKSIHDQNITSQTANELIQQFVRYNIDLAQASKLAAAAQDIAVVSGRNSSDTLESLVYGISTLNPLVLRTAGIQVDASNAYDAFAKSAGTSADALTDDQRVQAFVNATLQEAIPLQGAYTLAMESGYKVSGSLARVYENLAEAVGTPFQNAYYNVMKIQYDLGEAFTKLIEKGGALYDVFRTLGAIAAVATEGPRQFVSGLLAMVRETPGAGKSIVNSIVGPIMSVIERAAGWGMNIVANLADGIITGASFVLTAAMQFIGGVLASWLSAFSPPKVAPDLPKWGSAAMMSWLGGFTSVNFDVLEGIQGQLQKFLDMSTQAEEYQRYSAMIVQSLDEMRRGLAPTVDVVAALAQANTPYAVQLAELARRQFALAKATMAVAAADLQLKNAETALTGSEDKLNRLVYEYNKQRRAGADPATLRQRGLAIQAAQAEVLQSKEGIKAAEQAKKTADEQVSTYQEQVRLQERLLDQLSSMTSLTQQMASSLVGGVDALMEALGGLEELKAKPLAPVDLTALKNVDKEFEALKDRVREHWDKIMEPLTKKWTENISPTLKILGDNFGTFLGIVQKVSDALFGKPAVKEEGTIAYSLGETQKGLLETKGWGGVAVSLGEAFAKAFIEEVGNQLGKELAWAFPTRSMRETNRKRLEEWASEAANNFSDAFAQSLIEPEGGWGKLTPAGQAAIDAFGTGLRVVAVKLADLADEYSKWADALFVTLGKKWDEIKAEASKKWGEFKDEVIKIAKQLWKDLVGGSVLSDIEDDIRKTWDRIWSTATEKWNNIKSAILDPVYAARDNIATALSNIESSFSTMVGNLQTLLTDKKTGFLLTLDNLKLGFQAIGDYVTDTLFKGLKDFLDKVVTPLKNGFASVRDAVGWALDKLRDLWDWISNHSLPQWFTDLFGHHSRPDLAIGFDEIADSVGGLTGGLKPLWMNLLRFLPATSLARWAVLLDRSLAGLSERSEDLLNWLDDLGASMRDLWQRWSPGVYAAFGTLQARVESLRQAVKDLGDEIRRLPSMPGGEPPLWERPGWPGLSSAGLGAAAMPVRLASSSTVTNQWNFSVTTSGGLAAITQSYAIARALAGG